MLKNTFSHIPGIGLKTEKLLWNNGIHTWNDFESCQSLPLSQRKITLSNNLLIESRMQLVHNPAYFTKLLPPRRHWRIFPHFRQQTAYLDIETTGTNSYVDHITTIALYDGVDIYHYVHGENLEDFAEDITKYKLIVTYNGKSFDVPIIEKTFGIKLNHAHIDLRHVLYNLGYRGGLKKCEKQMGIDRHELDGVDGYFAVLLWNEYAATGNRKALETLLAYNIMDTVNLEELMVRAYNMYTESLPFGERLHLPDPSIPAIPFSGDFEVIEKLKRNYSPLFQ